MRQTLTTWLALLAAIYASYAGLLYVTQRSLLFPAAAADWPIGSRRLPPGVVEVELPATFGKVRAIYRQASAAGAGPALIYLHGNAEFAHQNADAFAALAARGVQVALVEYPGYAGADGAPSFDTLLEATTRAYDWLAQRPEVDAARIVAVGRSVGSGPAAELTGHRAVRALILLSPFTSLADFARARWLPGFLVRDRFDNRARVSRFAGPVLILHGRDDEIIPYAQGRALAAAAPAATLHDYACGHNDCPWFEPEFDLRLTEFLHRHGILGKAAAETAPPARTDTAQKP